MATKKTTSKIDSNGVSKKKTIKKTLPKKTTTVEKTVSKKKVSVDLFGEEIKTKKVVKKATKKTTIKKSTDEKPVAKKTAIKTEKQAKKTVVKKSSPKKTSTKKAILKEKIEEKKEYVKDMVDEVKELPDRYNETKLVLMMRDPQWCYFYWDISDDDRKKNNIEDKQLSVKIFRLSGMDVTINEQHVEVNVGHYYGDFFINLNSPHTYFIAELGFYLDGKFIVLARSNIVYAPRDSISNVYDDEYMVNEELMKIFYDTSTFVFSLSSMSILQILELKGLGGSSSSLFIPRKD